MQKHNYKNKRYKRKAFTLIELLIVIAIIGILFIVLVSKVDFATDKAKATGVQTDFRSFQLAFETVARENAGFSSLVDEDYDRLEMAINKNLDNKLKIDIDADGTITMANGATDPWNVEYHGKYVTGNDDKDRGAIVMYSNGSDLTFGSSIFLTGGMTSINTTGDAGKDDYVIVSCYSLVNGYGEIKNSTMGFSNNNILGNNQAETNPDKDDEVIEDNIPKIEPGLYNNSSYNNNDYSTPVKTWEQLLSENIVYVENGLIYSNYDAESKVNDSASQLSGTLVFPYDKSITGFAPYAFAECRGLNYCVIQSNITTISEYAFYNCTGLNKVTMSDNVTEVKDYAFHYCWALKWNELPKNLKTVGDFAFVCNGFIDLVLPNQLESVGEQSFFFCSAIQSLVLPDSLTYVEPNAFNQLQKCHTITMGNGLTTMTQGIFGNANALKTIYIPNTITRIENNALGNATSLETIVFDGTIEEWNAIEKVYNWYFSVPDTAIVQCKNGNILLKQ